MQSKIFTKINRKTTITITLIALLLILAALILPGRLKPTAPTEIQTETHTIRVLEPARTPYFLPQYLALNLGFFAEENLDVKIITTSPEAICTALAGRRADVALCDLQKLIFNPDEPERKKNSPLIFATMSCRDGSLLLGREKDPDFQWQKLQDKTIIGSPNNDSSEIALESILRQINILPYRQVTIYNNIPAKLRIGAFRAGTGHYLQLPEPEASAAEIKGYGQVVASVGTAGEEMIVTAYAAMPEYLEEHPEAIQKFTNAIYKAQIWLKQHSAAEVAAAAVSTSFANLETPVLTKAIERYAALNMWADTPAVEQEPYERFINAAKNAGEIPALVPYDSVVVTCFAKQSVQKTMQN